MNAYRVALILCRAVAVALFWMAGIRLVSLAILAIIALLNIGGLRSVPVLPFSLLSLPELVSIVPLFIGAGFLQIFAASLAASMTGGGAFEGDSISSCRTLDTSEKSLANAGAGLFLLFMGATNAMPPLLSAVYAILFGGFGSGATAAFSTYNLLLNLIPAVLQCLVGFVLAFSLGLRRVMKAQ